VHAGDHLNAIVLALVKRRGATPTTTSRVHWRRHGPRYRSNRELLCRHGSSSLISSAQFRRCAERCRKCRTGQGGFCSRVTPLGHFLGQECRGRGSCVTTHPRTRHHRRRRRIHHHRRRRTRLVQRRRRGRCCCGCVTATTAAATCPPPTIFWHGNPELGAAAVGARPQITCTIQDRTVEKGSNIQVV
jgi:hypothetical protein